MDIYNKVLGLFSEILWNDSIYFGKYMTYHYGSALFYIILSIRTSDSRKNISEKILKNFNVRQRTETRDLGFIKITCWKRRIIEQILLLWIFSIIGALSYEINNISIIGVVKSTFLVQGFRL